MSRDTTIAPFVFSDFAYAESKHSEELRWWAQEPALITKAGSKLAYPVKSLIDLTSLESRLEKLGYWVAKKVVRAGQLQVHLTSQELALAQCEVNARAAVRKWTLAASTEGLATGAFLVAGAIASVPLSFAIQLLGITRIRRAFFLQPDANATLNYLNVGLMGTLIDKQEAIQECFLSKFGNVTSAHIAYRTAPKVAVAAGEAALGRALGRSIVSSNEAEVAEQLAQQAFKTSLLRFLSNPRVLGGAIGAMFSGLAAHTVFDVAFHLSRLEALNAHGGFELPA